MKSIHIFQKFQLSYLCIGTGDHNVIAFSGIALDASSLKPLAAPFEQTHRFYIIDLFHAGESKINTPESTDLSPSELIEIVKNFIESKEIESFSIWGFSVGARVAMMLYPELKAHIQEVVLLAPDGIKKNIWYSFATKSLIGTWVFKHACHSEGIRKLLSAMAKVVMDKKDSKRIALFLQNSDALQLIYRQWMTYRNIQPTDDEFKALRQHDNVLILLAARDEFIKGVTPKKVLQKVPNAEVIVIEDSHLFLNQHTAVILHAKVMT